MSSLEPNLISEVEDILVMKELRDYANSSSTHENVQIRVIEILDKQIMNLRLDALDIKKRLFELERKLDSNKN